jgi:hypothetical protein
MSQTPPSNLLYPVKTQVPPTPPFLRSAKEGGTFDFRFSDVSREIFAPTLFRAEPAFRTHGFSELDGTSRFISAGAVTT